MDIHVVRQGETLSAIANQYGVSAGLLAADNGIPTELPLIVGETLVVRYPESIHTVVSGETVFSIAQEYGISVLDLLRRNFVLQGKNEVYPGQTLVIAYRDPPTQVIGVNGYAYPYINIDLLDSVLPYLTYLTPFTYGIANDGTLLPLGDTELRAAAGYYRATVLMHLSSLTESGQFSSERASLLLRSEELQENLIRSIIQNLRRKNFYGLDIDFEYLAPQDKDAYVAFINKLRERLNPLGYPVIVALAPKTSADQPGLLYAAHDYRAIGEAANAVLLMTYEWGYTYGPPMAVAPIPEVREVLDYAVTEIDPSKIFLGIPLYGYDWTLPFEQGVTKAESVSPADAMELAREYGAEIEYDEEAQSPYFNYYGRSGHEHVVWFEDARSMKAKLDLVAEYGLQGISYWNLTRSFPQNWALLDSIYDAEKLL